MLDLQTVPMPIDSDVERWIVEHLDTGVVVSTRPLKSVILANPIARSLIPEFSVGGALPSFFKKAVTASLASPAATGEFPQAQEVELPNGGRCFLRAKPMVEQTVLIIVAAARIRSRDLQERLKQRLGLSFRQVEIVSRLRLGRSNQEIATDLGLSVVTVKHYLNDIFALTDVRSRTQLIAAVAKILEDE